MLAFPVLVIDNPAVIDAYLLCNGESEPATDQRFRDLRKAFEKFAVRQWLLSGVSNRYSVIFQGNTDRSMLY